LFFSSPPLLNTKPTHNNNHISPKKQHVGLGFRGTIVYQLATTTTTTDLHYYYYLGHIYIPFGEVGSDSDRQDTHM
jgi:hypothetical protein